MRKGKLWKGWLVANNDDGGEENPMKVGKGEEWHLDIRIENVRKLILVKCLWVQNGHVSFDMMVNMLDTPRWVPKYCSN